MCRCSSSFIPSLEKHIKHDLHKNISCYFRGTDGRISSKWMWLCPTPLETLLLYIYSLYSLGQSSQIKSILSLLCLLPPVDQRLQQEAKLNLASR